MNLSRVAERYYARSREILGTMTLAMTTALETGSVSHNFIVQMIPHHQAAVEMAQNLLQYTTCVPLQELADRIIIEQTRGIETMQDAGLRPSAEHRDGAGTLCRALPAHHRDDVRAHGCGLRVREPQRRLSAPDAAAPRGRRRDGAQCAAPAGLRDAQTHSLRHHRHAVAGACRNAQAAALSVTPPVKAPIRAGLRPHGSFR